jgi:hypothetical protein
MTLKMGCLNKNLRIFLIIILICLSGCILKNKSQPHHPYLEARETSNEEEEIYFQILKVGIISSKHFFKTDRPFFIALGKWTEMEKPSVSLLKKLQDLKVTIKSISEVKQKSPNHFYYGKNRNARMLVFGPIAFFEKKEARASVEVIEQFTTYVYYDVTLNNQLGEWKVASFNLTSVH